MQINLGIFTEAIGLLLCASLIFNVVIMLLQTPSTIAVVIGAVIALFSIFGFAKWTINILYKMHVL